MHDQHDLPFSSKRPVAFELTFLLVNLSIKRKEGHFDYYFRQKVFCAAVETLY